MIESVLVANRGEIALRIVRACRELGIRSVAVYSEADALSPHVLHADEAYLIGPAPAAESYLRIDRLLEVASDAQVAAVHPGYGFLAEREPFARAVEEAGLTFVGPRSETIAQMGDKTEARRRMKAAGVPVVPGVEHAVETPEEALEIATTMGFPVLLKAAAGGGGKGMRAVESADGVASALDAARREATAAFGDGSVYIEKYLARPRHVEIQVLGDNHGAIVHLGERECSIQRRHQKLVEEAPSPALTPELRRAMGQAAVDAAAAVDYAGAGTVEFLFQDGEFFFLEMNTRIQVEHPVTELITGVDLVQWQLRVASGESLPFAQDDIAIRGHAVECRLTSEDPASGFLPSTGRIHHLVVPSGPGVRWDAGIEAGNEVGLHYDPLLAKLIVHAPDRPTAVARMTRALEELEVGGVKTSAEFHLRVMGEADFRAGDLTIRYLEDHPELTGPVEDDPDHASVAVAAALLAHRARSGGVPRRVAPPGEGGFSAWRAPAWSWPRSGADGR